MNSVASVAVAPHSIQAEQCVLGALMVDNNGILGLELSADDFYRKEHRIIYSAITDLHSRQEPFDIVTLDRYLTDSGESEKTGGFRNLAELARSQPSAANIAAYAGAVSEKAAERVFLAALASATRMMYEGSTLSSIERRTQALGLLMKAADKTTKGEFRSLKEILNACVNTLEKRFLDDAPVWGAPSGLDELDKITGGFHRGDLIIIAGRPSMGKTAMAMGIATHVGESTGKRVAVFSLEMPAEMLALRMMAGMGEVNLGRLRRGNLAETDWALITSAIARLSALNVDIDEELTVTVPAIHARCRNLQARHGDLGMVVVDYLQLIMTTGKYQSKTDAVGAQVRELKGMAKDLGVPVIVLSQLNRALEQRPLSQRRPQMSDLRDSGSIEQDADLILFPYRHVVYEEECSHPDIAEIIIGKHRNGKTGKTLATFSGEYCRFTNYSGEAPPERAWKDSDDGFV